MDHVQNGYQSLKVKSHLIFCRVLNDTIEVIRIMHERMDVENRINDYQLRITRVFENVGYTENNDLFVAHFGIRQVRQET